MRDSVGIFGGAFDPIHKGHTKSLLEIKNLINFSELKIIPCGLPSQKDKTEASNHERLSMLEMTFRGHQNIKIDPIEIEKKSISYTVDTLETFKKSYKPDQHFTLIMGLDAFLNFTTWKNYKRILELSSLLVMQRPNYKIDRVYLEQFKNNITEDIDVFLNNHGKIIFYSLSQFDISSTKIKQAIKNELNYEDYLEQKVVDFLEENSIYK